MAINDLSPAFARIYYTTLGNSTHIMTLPCVPSGDLIPGEEPAVLTYSGTPMPFGDAVTAYLNVVKPLWPALTSFLFAEFWSKPTPNDDPLFIWQEELAIAGTGAGSSQAYVQVSVTFRTQYGGLFRNVFIEPNVTPNQRDDVPFGNATLTNLLNYLKGTNSWIYGRDGGKIIAGIRMLSKTNDQLRKRGMLNIS